MTRESPRLPGLTRLTEIRSVWIAIPGDGTHIRDAPLAERKDDDVTLSLGRPAHLAGEVKQPRAAGCRCARRGLGPVRQPIRRSAGVVSHPGTGHDSTAGRSEPTPSASSRHACPSDRLDVSRGRSSRRILAGGLGLDHAEERVEFPAAVIDAQAAAHDRGSRRRPAREANGWGADLRAGGRTVHDHRRSRPVQARGGAVRPLVSAGAASRVPVPGASDRSRCGGDDRTGFEP